MYELKQGTARLVNALYAIKDNERAIATMAQITNYVPEQLSQDIQALYNSHNAEQGQKLLTEYIGKTEDELNEVFNLGFFNEIVKGYLTLSLQEQGKPREEIRATQRTLETLFDEVGAEEARRASQNS